MPRMARIVIPDLPHHVTQRGNRREDVFFDDKDRRGNLGGNLGTLPMFSLESGVGRGLE